MKDYTEYLLTNEEYTRCKEELLFELLLEGERASKPEVSFVVGQPGAGKTGISIWSKRDIENNSHKCIEINADKVATYHKHYQKMLDLLPEERLKISREFVNPCIKEIQDIMMEKKFNMVMECTLNSNKKIAMMKKMKELGYKVNINVLAVDYYESFLSCFEREAEMLKLELKSRGIDKKNHDDSYYNMLKTIEQIQQEGCFDKIGIFKRGICVVEPIKIAEVVDDKTSATELIVNERKRQREQLLKNPNKYSFRIQNAKTTIEMLGKNTTLIEKAIKDIDGLEKEFINEQNQAKLDDEQYL